MRRALAHHAEVARRRHDAATEVMVPDAVDHDPGRQGIRRVGKPAGQRGTPPGEPPAARRHHEGGTRIQNRQESGLNLLKGPGVLSVRQNVRGWRVGVHVRDAGAARNVGRLQVGELLKLRVERLETGLVLSLELSRHVSEQRIQVRLRPQRAGAAGLGGEQARHPLLHRRAAARGHLDRLDHEIGVPGQQFARRVVPERHQEIRHLLPDVRGTLLPDRELAPVLAEFGGGHDRKPVVVVDVRKERLQPVVVLLSDRIELVVVAPGTVVGQPEKRRADDGRNVVQRLLPGQQEVLLVALLGVVAVEGRCDPGLEAVRPELVARDLLADEPVVRLVGVERRDHVVPVPPGVPARDVPLEAGTLREPRQVEPVSAPALAVVRGGEQALDEPLVGIGRAVPDELPHLFRRRRQPDQGEEGSPD